MLGDITIATLQRWQDDPKINFPKPIIINRRRLFDRAEVVKWQNSARQSRPSAVAPPAQTLRDRLAMAAMAGMLANPDSNLSKADLYAEDAYLIADAMMRARAP